MLSGYYVINATIGHIIWQMELNKGIQRNLVLFLRKLESFKNNILNGRKLLLYSTLAALSKLFSLKVEFWGVNLIACTQKSIDISSSFKAFIFTQSPSFTNSMIMGIWSVESKCLLSYCNSMIKFNAVRYEIR